MISTPHRCCTIIQTLKFIIFFKKGAIFILTFNSFEFETTWLQYLTIQCLLELISRRQMAIRLLVINSYLFYTAGIVAKSKM